MIRDLNGKRYEKKIKKVILFLKTNLKTWKTDKREEQTDIGGKKENRDHKFVPKYTESFIS